MNSSRRRFLAGIGAAAFANRMTKWPMMCAAQQTTLKLGVITDEISQDLDHALAVARELGLQFVELRMMWDRNLMDLKQDEMKEARRLLTKYGMKVTDIASPFMKVDAPGFTTKEGQHDTFNARFGYKEQPEVLERAIELAKVFDSDTIRVFSFWRIEKPAEVFDLVVADLRRALEKVKKHKISLALENEHDCNIATAAESVKLLSAIQDPNFGLNWDPGNAYAAGERAYPDGYNLLPKNRIIHMHVKDAKRDPATAATEWYPMGKGDLDYVGQFKALMRDGYNHVVSLETHWRNEARNAEESTRVSMRGLKNLISRASVT
jgi:L-ribulose-5-phosphate 3-epimerase